MSHFSVMVVTAEEPTEAVLSKMLQPWHEFECTGHNDQYVQDVDRTQETLDEYKNETRSMYKDPDGVLHTPYDAEFYREPSPEEIQMIGPMAGSGAGHGISWTSRDWDDGRGYRVKVHFLPEGWEEVDVPVSEIMTLEEFIGPAWNDWKIVHSEDEIDVDDTHKYGYALFDDKGNLVRHIRRTNPNAKWDWWSVGGRWTGAFSPGYDPENDPDHQEKCFLCNGSGMRNDSLGCEARAEDPSYTCNGCDGKGYHPSWPTNWKNIGNQVQVKDLPLEQLRTLAEEKAAKRYDRLMKIVNGREIPDWGATCAKYPNDIEKAREEFRKNPVVKAVDKDAEFTWIDWNDYQCTRDEYLDRARKGAIATFAFVKDGEWFERGDMGWFGCVSNEKDKNTWNDVFNKMLDDLSPDTWLTLVDCHI